MRPARKRAAKDPRATRPPLRFGDDPLLWASWLYYEEGLTQNEIAEELGASRPTVNAYLADARAKGIVNISISGEKLRSVTIGREIEERFGLEGCVIVPGEGGPRSLIDRLGAVAAQSLRWLIHSGDTVAITWGRTMLALANAVRELDLLDIVVVQATGGTTAAIDYTPEACATRLAENLGARFVPISAPAIVSSPEARQILLAEPVIAEQLKNLERLTCILFGISSMRPNSTIHTSGFFDRKLQQKGYYNSAVGSLAGRFIDAQGVPIAGPLADRTIGIELDRLRRIPKRVLVAGGFDKVPPILAALRGGYVTALITDAGTGEGILRAEGLEVDKISQRRRATSPPEPALTRSRIKKFINQPRDVVREALEGALAAFPAHIESIDGSVRAIRSRVEKPQGKVGIVIGGGAGHEPGFFGFVGRGLADAVVVGNVFASPPPDRILSCTRDVHRGAGVLYIYGNYTGDVMNFDIAADLAAAEGIETRAILTTDDIASSGPEDAAARRGTAGNVFVFKIAGAASARMLPLDVCERLVRKANFACHTIGVALEPCSMPDTQRPSFSIGQNEMEFGVGVHGEPGVTRMPLQSADRIVDQICDRIFEEMRLESGGRVAVLVNSLGATPMMELLVVNRRLMQRLSARSVKVHTTLVGHYFTSLDMVGASVTIMGLDEELAGLLDAPCSSIAWIK
ncbi:bifunctional sugar-binding transcriptional regulator/dihydroxyacetone kinase subunit DhaK [Tropicimonas sp. IMCC6043]|uniref:bifunctional sugar-binding transcriptional regulator/dihydroxyacetone kinase subunit DhaK n=1 Tax=Tropicimonas sp. IMCC6043 TaxID=2510645 RepID=UPI00101BBAE1|nr:bifunctional sugar-binding transcriptional regulator/dihydroxyacetone kinase subunit DhaK [Tropicimonas sp. IMCC6043]RYH06286.1 bifunctional sugar-binding transcriptional regulator/dihydroxyacetone kinase subunit DhaK [Tropicimonas sp. IMCC6043]